MVKGGHLTVTNVAFSFVLVVIVSFTDTRVYGNELCAGGNATLECLKVNFDELEVRNRPLFWRILHDAADRASLCCSHLATAGFLELAGIERYGAEFEEFLHERIEKIVISSTACFFESMLIVRDENQSKIMNILINPIFAEGDSVKKIFLVNSSNKRYETVVKLYFEKLAK